MNTNTDIVILAAGKGTRMGGEVPKALTQLGDKSMLEYVTKEVSSFTENKPVIVVGYKKEMITDLYKDSVFYAEQVEQLGTGHAVNSAKNFLEESSADTIIVLYADQPFVSSDTMEKLSSTKKDLNAKIVIATSVVEDDELFEKQFYNFGRIIRNDNNEIVKIVEKKDATEAELSVREVNPAYFCLDKSWALEKLSELKNDNAQAEYYLTDLVSMAFGEDLSIESVQIDPKEALGANTKDQLAVLESFLDK